MTRTTWRYLSVKYTLDFETAIYSGLSSGALAATDPSDAKPNDPLPANDVIIMTSDPVDMLNVGTLVGIFVGLGDGAIDKWNVGVADTSAGDVVGEKDGTESCGARVIVGEDPEGVDVGVAEISAGEVVGLLKGLMLGDIVGIEVGLKVLTAVGNAEI